MRPVTRRRRLPRLLVAVHNGSAAATDGDPKLATGPFRFHSDFWLNLPWLQREGTFQEALRRVARAG